MNILKEYKFKVIGYYFEPNFEEATERNKLRKGKEVIPIVGIKSTLSKLQAPSFDEGFDELFKVQLVDNQFLVSKL